MVHMKIKLLIISILAFFSLSSVSLADVVSSSTPYKTSEFRQSVSATAHQDYGPGVFCANPNPPNAGYICDQEDSGNLYQLYTPGFGSSASEPVEHTWKNWACNSKLKVLRGVVKPWPGFTSTSWGNNQINDLYNSCGIKWILFLGPPRNVSTNGSRSSDFTDGLAALAHNSVAKESVHAIELENEADNFYWSSCRTIVTSTTTRHCTISEWAQRVRDEAVEVRAWMDANGWSDIPLYAPSFIKSGPCQGCGGYSDQPDPYDVGDLSAYVTHGNIHPYSGGLLPENALGDPTKFDSNLFRANLTAPGKPVVVTEFGFHTPCTINSTSGVICSYRNGSGQVTPPHPGVDENTQSIYLVRAFADYFNKGIKHSSMYELLDERYDYTANQNGENHFGLVRRNLTAKPSYNAIGRLMGYFERNVDFTPTPMEVKVTSPTGISINTVAFQYRDGTTGIGTPRLNMVVLIWRPVSVWDRTTFQPVNIPSENITLEVKRCDWPWGMYMKTERPTTPNSLKGSFEPVTNGCWRKWSVPVNGELTVANIWY